jgi:hypothetical protein
MKFFQLRMNLLIIGLGVLSKGILFAQTEVVDFYTGHDFFLEISILDTVPCKVTTMRGRQGTQQANLLKISVDSVIRVFNEGIYDSDEELKNTQYMWVPKDVNLKNTNNYVLTFDQYQKDYFYFLQKTLTADIEIIRTGKMKENPSIGYGCGLLIKVKTSRFRRWWGTINNMPEYKIVAKAKPVKKSKDPTLKCIKKYEKATSKQKS